MTTERRPTGTRPYIGSVPALPISVLHLRGWKWSERYGDATRAGSLEYTRRGAITGRVVYKAKIGRETGTLSLECSFGCEGPPTAEVIDMVSVPNAWGGRHWFFVCPLTGRRARKLHRWPGSCFSHREASPISPVYASQRDSGLGRTARAMQEIRDRLGGVPGKFDKPKGMPWRTYYRLCMRYVELHDRFWRSVAEGFARRTRLI